MTTGAIDALRADHEALADLAERFTPQEWTAPSSCAGWAVRDVVGHMTQLFRQVVDPGSLPPGDPSGSTERTQDLWVEALRPLPVEQVLADYRELGGKAIAALAGLQGNDTPLDLGDLGTHPLHLVANSFSFDHYTHIRADLLAPLGPLPYEAPPSDEVRLAAAMDWMVAGLPQMDADGLASIGAPVVLELTGPGGRTARFGPGDDDAPAVATVTTSTEDFVLWGTRRRSWRDLDVRLGGDTDVARRFCEAVHVF